MQHSEPTSGSPANVAPLSGAVAPWLACGPVLDVPAAMAALAMPSRRFPGTPACADPDRAWELFLTHARAARKPEFDRCEPEFVAAARQADARVEQGVRAGSLLSDAVMLGMSTLFEDRLARSDGSPFVDFLVAERGLPYALEVLLTGVEKMRIDVDDKRLGQPWCVGAAGQQWQFSRHRGSFSMAELAYRGHLAHASDDIWMQCVQAIRNCLERVPPHRQVLLALLLPDVPEVSDALVMEREYDLRSFDFWLNLTVSAPVREQTLALRARMMAMLPGSLGGECQYHSEPFAVATLLQEYGADAVALLAPGVTVRVTGEALLCIGTPEAVTALARGLTGKYNKAAVLDRLRAAVSRWPYAALAGLAELSATEGPIPLAGRSLLATLVSEHAAQLPAFKPWISEQAAAVLDDFAARFALAGQIADPADLPPVLANPPWLKPRKKTLAALALAPLPLAPAEHWTADQREDMRSEERYSAYPWNARRFAAPEQAAAAIEAGDLDALLAIWQACVGDGHYLGGCVHAIVDMPEPYNAAVWNALAQHPINSPGYAVATLGLRGLPGLVAMCERRPADDLVYAQYIAAIELAAPVARALATLKTYAVRAAARRWLLAYPEHAACGLLAPALGKAGRAREYAAAALRMMAGAGHEALLIEVAARYQQPAVLVALRAMLNQDPLDLFPAKFGAAPAFWTPHSWTRPRLASNGKALPEAALDALGAMLRFPQTEGVYAGLEQVRQACTPACLTAFAWELFCEWQEDGMDSKENWVFNALRVFGDDDVARKLTPLIRSWPGAGQHARAVAGLDVLAAIGTDTAMLLLNGIAHRVKFKGLQESAREKIRQIAEARNMTAEELEDRIVPDLGLDDDGALLLDFGPRQFRVGFDETLKPYVRDQDGARLAELPKPKPGDDAELARAAAERYKLLKKDARAIAAQQVLRLEVAMCARRRWQTVVFNTFLAGHPLVRHLVQRLVWGVYVDGRLESCFRVDPDGGFTNAGDDAYTLGTGDDVRIGVVHLLEMPAADVAAFGQLFADYELMQPFAQLGRDTYALTSAELASDRLQRWDGVVVPTGKVLGLTNRGWRRGRTQEHSYVWEFTKACDDGRLVELSITPGIMLTLTDEHDEQTLKQVSFGSTGRHGRVDKSAPLAALDPIAASELIRDLQWLGA